MLNVRSHSVARFNVLLTEDRARHDEVEHWTRQLPRLLEPLGVASFLARTGRQAVELAEHHEIHAAVIDMATPVDEQTKAGGDGMWVVELLNRMEQGPAVVVINSPAFTQRDVQRSMHNALRLGAFAVLNRPIELNQLLAVFRKVLDRQYKGTWPL